MEISRRAATKALLKRQRKMHSRKAEIERLKGEYEKYKTMNEQIIESKMRQVRLNRLFREIEELKEISALRAKQRPPMKRPKTEEEHRIDNIKRARALGQEFSRLNALAMYDHLIDDLREDEVINKSNQKLYFLEKRITYGNEVSKTNTKGGSVVKKTVKKQRKPIKPESRRLEDRLSYGNTNSYINLLLGLKKKNRSILAELLREGLTVSQDASDDLLEQDLQKAEQKADEDQMVLHQDLLNELQQMANEKDKKRKLSHLEGLDLQIQDFDLNGDLKRVMKQQKSKEKSKNTDNNKENVKKRTKKLKRKQQQQQQQQQIHLFGSSSGDELIATPRFIQESLLSKKKELAAQHAMHDPRSRVVNSFPDLNALLKNTAITEANKSKESVPSSLVPLPSIQSSKIKSNKQSPDSVTIPTTLEQLRNFFNHDSDDNDSHNVSVRHKEEIRKVAEIFAPEIRKAVERESTKYRKRQVHADSDNASDKQSKDFDANE